jgi:hypothetical protein
VLGFDFGGGFNGRFYVSENLKRNKILARIQVVLSVNYANKAIAFGSGVRLGVDRF